MSRPPAERSGPRRDGIVNGEHDHRAAHAGGRKEDPQMLLATGLQAGRQGVDRGSSDAFCF